MKPRHRAAGEAQDAAHPDLAGNSSSDTFRVDARIGHAWFARSQKSKLPIPRGPDMLPALRRAELILAGQGRAIARRATRVPSDAIVALGAALSSSSERLRTAGTVGAASHVANDNSSVLSPRTKTILREIAFLVVFGATLAGTYYLGRMHGAPNVISVPDPAPRANKIV